MILSDHVTCLLAQVCTVSYSDMSTPLLPEVVPEIDANRVSFYWGRGEGIGQVWSLTRQSYAGYRMVSLSMTLSDP